MNVNQTSLAIAKFEDLLKTIDGLSEDEKNEYAQYLACAYTRDTRDKEQVSQDEMESYLRSKKLYGDEGLLKLMGVIIAFMPYINASPHFELFFSEKSGAYFAGRFVGPDFESTDHIEIENAWIISDADDLFDFLSNEIFNDVFELKINGDHFDNILQENEISELLKRIEPFLSTFVGESREYYTKRFSTNLTNWMES